MRPTLPHHPSTGWLSRRSVRLLAGTTLAITGCLAVAVPAHAAVLGATAPAASAVGSTTSGASSASAASASSKSGSADSLDAAAITISATTASASTSVPASLTAAAAASVTHAQTLSVSGDASVARIVQDTFTAAPPDVSALLAQAAPQTDATTIASTASALGVMPGQRLAIVGAALAYLGTPYVLGGASHAGIDCSGLTMVAYQAAGVQLAHYVPTQDAAGHTIAAADAKPGDLIVFDNEEHVAMYLGGGLLVAAPEPGRDVQIEQLSEWSGIGYHFTRVLSD